MRRFSYLLAAGLFTTVAAADQTFVDNFESADFSGAGGFSWGGTNRTSIVRDDGYVVNNGKPTLNGPHASRQWENGPESAGRHALRFRYASGEAMAEQRFSLSTAYPDLWIAFWWRVPTNFYHEGGNDNQKLLALWMDDYEYSGKGPTVVWQFRRYGEGGSIPRVYYVATDSGQSQRHSGEISGRAPLITTPSDRGRWMHLVFHVKRSSGPGKADGVIQMWRRWEGESSYQSLHDINNATIHAPSSPSGFRAGYVMGWANAPYSKDTEFLVDDFTVSDSPLLSATPPPVTPPPKPPLQLLVE